MLNLLRYRPARRRVPLLLSAAVALPFAAAMPGGWGVAILGIGFLIFIHEWGHFYACKLTGTRTETFSIGFGPRLFGWEKDRDGNRRFTAGARQLDPMDHAMDFRIALIPLGGYVKMAGELPGESTSGAPDEFPQKSAGARAFIICAGVIMNFITAIVFYSITYGAGKPYDPAVVASTTPGSPAHAAGIQPADRVLEFGGKRIEDRIDLLAEAAMAPRGEAVDVVIERDGKRVGPLSIRAGYDDDKGRMIVGIRAPALGLTLGSGDETFKIGWREPILVEGLPVRGGAAVAMQLKYLVQIGRASVKLARADGTTFTVKPTPLEKAPETLPVKIGVAPFEIPTVRGVQGAAGSALQKGDKLLAMLRKDAAEIEVTGPISVARAIHGGAAVTALRIEREGKTLEQKLDPALVTPKEIDAFFHGVDLRFDGKGTRVRPLGVDETLYDIEGTLYQLPTSPTLDAGVTAGMRVVRVGERDVASFQDIAKALEGLRKGDSIDLWIEADSGRKKVTVAAAELQPLGTLAITPERHVEHHDAGGFFGALGRGSERTLRETTTVFRTIGALFGGTLSFQKNIAGPITLVRASKNQADGGFLRLLWFLAYISVMLAVLNILPIPVLDGGHLLFIIIEKIKGSPLSDTVMFRFQQIGLLMLLALMFFAFKNDIMRL